MARESQPEQLAVALAHLKVSSDETHESKVLKGKLDTSILAALAADAAEQYALLGALGELNSRQLLTWNFFDELVRSLVSATLGSASRARQVRMEPVCERLACASMTGLLALIIQWYNFI